jgi:hypothetical protein
MTPGDQLVYAADPLRFGVLELFAVTADGWLWCEELTTHLVHRLSPSEVEPSPVRYMPTERRWAA